MIASAALPALRLALYEGPGAQPLDPPRRRELLRALLDGGFAVSCLGAGAEIERPEPGSGAALLILYAAEAPSAPPRAPENASLRLLDIGDADAAGVLQLAREAQAAAGARKPGEWKPWFPVIDYARCTHCMQCLSFCLFDVYGVDGEKRLLVQNPDKCKTNCPACSRVCPEVAIVFPKYSSGPINGDAVNARDIEREKMKVDISALLGGDIYSLLRERHAKAQSRFSKERDEGKALKERLKCLQKLQGDMSIPPEVLMALPSLESIQEKAKAAHEAARNAVAERAALAGTGPPLP